MSIAEAHRLAGRGDFTSLPVDAEGEWSPAVAARWSLVASEGVSSTANLALVPQESVAMEFARADVLLRALLSMDVATLGALAKLADPGVSNSVDLARGWLTLFHGDAEGALSITQTLDPRIEELRGVWGALRAMAHLEQGDVKEGLRLARQTSRLTRADGVLAAEYLANVVLARGRRLSGLPHLSARILRSLLEVMPEHLRPWATWESALCGGGHEHPLHAALTSPSGSGAEERWSLAKSAARAAFAQRELLIIEAALRVTTPPATLAPDILGWFSGEFATMPSALVGLSDVQGPDAPIAYLVATPTQPARRVLPEALRAVSATALEASGRSLVRTDTALCSLAVAGPSGISRGDFFHAVYRFDFDQVRYGTMLRQLLRRTRLRLGDHGTVEGDDERFRLELHAPIAIPDPRCPLELDERILRCVGAMSGPVGARDVAAEIGVAIRTVHGALNRLLDDGAFVMEKKGRKVTYALEDTTFREPTITRMSPRLPKT